MFAGQLGGHTSAFAAGRAGTGDRLRLGIQGTVQLVEVIRLHGCCGTRRWRRPGVRLRREEAAQPAFISTEYYTRLERARGPRPSREVLAGPARALRLSDAERDHLHHLAGAPPGPPPGPSREVRQSILDLLHRLPQAAAIVTSPTGISAS